MTFCDTLLLKQGLEYSAKLPCGKTVVYLSRETAEVYRDFRGAEIVAPFQGPHMPECFKRLYGPVRR